MRDHSSQDARPPPGTVPRRLAPRLLRILLIGLAALYVPYLIAGNIVLRTQLIQKVLDGAVEGTTVRIVVTYDSIWTFFPGQIWVKGAVVRGHDFNVEWSVRVDDHVAWIDALGFANRTFRVLRARGTGVEFRLRMRKFAYEHSPENLALLPRISPYTDPPLHPDVPRPKKIESGDPIWSIRLDDIEMEDVREVWIETMRWLDSGKIHGGFAFTPGRSLRVAGAYDVRAGELRRGDTANLSHVRGRTHLAIVPIDISDMSLHDVLRHLDFSGHLDAKIDNLSMLPLAAAGVTHHAIDARLLFLGRIRLGVLDPGTSMRLSIKRIALHGGGVAVAASGNIGARVGAVRAGGRTGLAASIDLAPISVTRLTGSGDEALNASVHVGLVSPNVDLGTPFDPGRVIAEAKGRLADAGLIGAWLPGSIASPSGAVSFDANVRFDTARAEGDGRISLDAPALTFKVEDLAVRGHLSTEVLLSHIAFPAPPGASPRLEDIVFQLNGSRVELRDVSVTKPGRAATESGWWLRVHVPGAMVRPGVPALSARLTTRFRDADPILMLLDRALGVPAVMLKPLTRAEFEAHATLRYRRGLFALEDFDVDGGTFRIEGWYLREGARRRGAFLAEMGGTALGVNVTTEKVGVVFNRPREWYRDEPRPP